MPFGLSNVPAVFQALVNDVLRDMLNKYVFVYMDDILIFSPDEDTHVQHVHQVLQRLLTHQLFVKAEKCEFHVSSVAFLGFIVSQDNIQMDPAKVSTVTEWSTPTSRKHLQCFLGFANFYRRFIRNFSTIASPLHNLTSSNMKFQWSLPAERVFQRLKETFTTAPVLTLPDPSLQFMVEVDASDVGVDHNWTRNSIPAPFSLGNSLPLNEITMWGTGSCWLLKWLWRNGVIGWREQSSPSWFGRITKTLSTSGPPSDSIPDRPDGLCVLIDLTSPCHIALVPRMLKQMHCLVCLTLVLPRSSPLISCLHPVW